LNIVISYKTNFVTLDRTTVTITRSRDNTVHG